MRIENLYFIQLMVTTFLEALVISMLLYLGSQIGDFSPLTNFEGFFVVNIVVIALVSDDLINIYILIDERNEMFERYSGGEMI